jgi:hypothetical protein
MFFRFNDLKSLQRKRFAAILSNFFDLVRLS